MIALTRLNHVPLVVNSDLIEHIEVTPDTVIALTTGQKFLVLESAEEVIERILGFRRRLLSRTILDPIPIQSQNLQPASDSDSNEK